MDSRRSGRRLSHAHPVGHPARAIRPPRTTIPRSGTLSATVLFAAAAAVLLIGQLLTRGAASTAALIPDSARSAELAFGATTSDAAGSARTTQMNRTTDGMGAGPDPASGLAAQRASLGGYGWPLQHARITQGFGRSRGALFIVNGEAFHDGIDVASFCGDRVVAAHDGVVIAAGRRYDGDMGWIGDLAAYQARLDAKGLWGSLAIGVIVDDGTGYRSVYLHFSRIVVKTGQVVRAGDLLGLEGATGHATGCHLHYSLFSPAASGRFETDPSRVKAALLPAAEIARVDPLLLLPPLATAAITWGWGAHDAP